MNATCTQENFSRGIAFVSHLSSRHTSLPILNNILVSATEKGLDLIATNLEIGIRARVRAKVESPGDVTVNGKLIMEYVYLLPKGHNIVLSTVDGELKVSCGSQQSHIKGLSAEDFPLLPTIEGNQTQKIRIPVQELRRCVQKTMFAISPNETRPEIGGALFWVEGTALTVVGTDSYRLSELTTKVSESSGNCRVIIPVKTWSEVLRLSSMDLEGDAVITISENQIAMELGDVYLISRLIEGQYPDYKQIIPSDTTTVVTVKRDELVQAVKAASLFSKAGMNDIRLTTNEQAIQVSSSNIQVGENVVEVEATREGAEMTSTFNYRYLLDGLASLTTESIRMELVDKNSPAVLRSPEEAGFLYLVMPIKQ